MPRWTRSDMAYWSTPRQLRKAGLFAQEGLILGAAYGQLLRHNGPEHMLVVASTQSGKSSCIVLPNLLTWRQSIMCHDPKEELAPLTAGWRSTFSRVVNLAPVSSASQCYNPLDAIRLKTDYEVRDAQLVAEMLTDPDGTGNDHKSSAGIHFDALSNEAKTALLLWGLYTQRARSLAAFRALLTQHRFAAITKQMLTYPHGAIRAGAMVLDQITGEGESSSIFSTTVRALSLYSDPLVARATDSSDFTVRDLRERARPMSLYLSIPFGDQERLRPWTRLVLRQLLDYCVSRKEGWRWTMLGLIDEVPGLKRLTLLSDGPTYVAGYGVRFVLITPSMAKLIESYGPHHNFMEGCKVKVAFGLEDTATPDLFSKRVGETEVKRRRQTGRGQWVTERVKEPLLSPTALMQLPPDQALVIVGQQKVLAHKTFYRHNAVWLRRSQIPCS